MKKYQNNYIILFKINKLYLGLIFSAILTGGASFSKASFRNEINHLNKNEIHRLNGKFAMQSIKDAQLKYNQSIGQANAFSELFNKPLKDVKKINCNYFSLQLKNPITLKITLYYNTDVVKDTVVTGKVKKGMFYLNNTYLKCHGVPFLFGGCEHNKWRIGITKEGNLLINEAVSNEAVSNEGALLFLIGSGYSYNSVYEFQRVIRLDN